MGVVEKPQSPEVSRLFQQGLERLWDERAFVATLMVGAIADSVSNYGLPADPELADDVYHHCYNHIEGFVNAARERRPPRPDEIEFIREAATRRVGRFLPLEAVLHAYRVGMRAAADWLIEQLGESLSGREAALDATRLLMEYLDAISQVLAEAYLRAHERVVADADRRNRDLLEDLLGGRFRLDDATRATLAALGLEPMGSHVLVVAVSLNAGGLAEITDAFHKAFVDLAQLPPVVARRDEVLAIVPGQRPAATRRVMEAAQAKSASAGISMRVGISAVFKPITEAPRAYEDALRALHRADAETPVVSLAETSLFSYLTAFADQTAEGLVAATVDRFLEEDARHDGIYVETLQAYLANDLNVSRTAKLLVVHPNTVTYRLGRMAKLSGGSMRDVTHLVELIAGIRVRRPALRWPKPKR